MKKKLLSDLRDALLIAFPVLVVFMITPLQIYLNNQDEFQYEYETMSVFVIVYLISFLFAWLLVKVMHEKWRNRFSAIFFYSGLYLLLSILFVPVQVRELIGKNELDLIAEPFYLSALEVLLSIGVIISAIKNPWEKVRVFGSIFSLIAIFGLAGMFLTKVELPEKKSSTQLGMVSQAKTEGPNIYHFVFDAFDTILFKRLIDASNVQNQFNGFTYYKNNICNYATTSLSIPSLMTGKFLDGEISKDDFNFISGGVMKALKNKGYHISQYDMYSSCHEATDYWVSPQTIDGDLIRKSNVLKLADLSILVAAPNYLQNEFFKNGKGLISRLILSEDDLLLNWEARDTVVSKLMIAKLISDEYSRDYHGEYVFAHFLLPHPPYALDQNCNFIGKQSSNIIVKAGQLNLINQNFCVVKQMVKILKNLRETGKFNSSLIIIQSDHGELDRIQTLLLIKEPTAADVPMKTSNYYTHLLDVAPTIIDAAGVEKITLEGRSLISSETSDIRYFPLALGLSKTKKFKHVIFSEGKIRNELSPIIRTDIP